MARPRMRFTLLGQMAFVAMLAIGLGMWAGVTRSVRRARYYRVKADEMTLAEQEHCNLAARLHHQAIIKEVEVEQDRERA
jgi:hypothetical protein